MSRPDPQIRREQVAGQAMASALPPLRRLAAAMRDAYGDPPEARVADALRLMLAEMLTSTAHPHSDEMRAAHAALSDLRPTQPEDEPHE